MLSPHHRTSGGAAQTRVTWRWEASGTATEAVLAAFAAARGGMTVGWTESFDKLEAVLAP